MKTRWRILIGVGVLVGLGVLGSIVHHFRLKAQVGRYLAELKAKGEPMELAGVVPPALPPEQNSAPLFWKAVSLLDTNEVLNDNLPPAMHGLAVGKAMVGWAQPTVRSSYKTNSWEEVKEALIRDNGAFNLLFEITNSAKFDFNLQYAERFEMRLTYLSLEKKAVQRLQANTLLALHIGDAGLAVKSVRTMLLFVNGTHEERIAISQLVRIAIAQIALRATWELLQAPNLSEQQLAALQSDWNRPEFILAAQNFIPVEREGSETMLEKWRNSNSELQHYFDLQKKLHEAMMSSDEESPKDSVWNKVKMKTQVFMWRYWWSYQDELRYLKGCEVLINTTRTIAAEGAFKVALANQDAELKKLGIFELNSSLDSLFSNKTDFHSMQSESIVTLSAVIKKILRVEFSRKAAVTAIALKRYQIIRGKYPEELKSLVPEFIPTVPLDPVDGQPLRYRLNTGDTFTLYSVGENGLDDGGSPAMEKGLTDSGFNWPNPHAFDWVWPQPATAAEIKYFYEHPPK